MRGKSNKVTDSETNTTIPFSVVTWNCLADCYSRGPCAESSSIVPWKYRSKLINDILTNKDLQADILCLQEIDAKYYETHFLPFLYGEGYHVEYTKRNNRQDGILIAFKAHKFRLVRRSVLRYDDLSLINHIPSPLTVDSLRKQNIALITCLQPISCTSVHADTKTHVHRDRAFIVCNTHLYWNPHFSQVKLAQTHYLLDYLAKYKCGDDPHSLSPCGVVLAGDFNSEPCSQQYQVIKRGKPVHPLAVHDRARSARNALSKVTHSRNTEERENSSDSQNDGVTRFLCDATLSKLVRWLRLLGIDTAIEDKESQDRRAFHNDYSPLFSRARREKRILVTTSINMQKRNTCPETFLIRTSSSNNQLKSDLAALLTHYDVHLEKDHVFTVCCKCGGRILETDVDDDRLNGKFVPTDRQIFICKSCYQPYWFSERTEGCSTRALKLAYSLFAYVQAAASSPKSVANGKLKGPTVKAEHASWLKPLLEDESTKGPLPGVPNCAKQWLAFESVFTQIDGQEPECTNINGSFRGTLDYIFVSGALIAETATVHKHRNGDNGEAHKLYPNSDWPSDHLMIRADILLDTRLPKRGWLPRSSSNEF